MDQSDTSRQMRTKLLAILPKVAAAHDAFTVEGLVKIDLSLAENLVLREELLVFCKDSISNGLTSEASSEINPTSKDSN
jgi:hypothetical protein